MAIILPLFGYVERGSQEKDMSKKAFDLYKRDINAVSEFIELLQNSVESYSRGAIFERDKFYPNKEDNLVGVLNRKNVHCYFEDDFDRRPVLEAIIDEITQDKNCSDRPYYRGAIVISSFDRFYNSGFSENNSRIFKLLYDKAIPVLPVMDRCFVQHRNDLSRARSDEAHEIIQGKVRDSALENRNKITKIVRNLNF